MMVTIPLSVIIVLLILVSGVLGCIAEYSADKDNALLGAICSFLIVVLAGVGGYSCS